QRGAYVLTDSATMVALGRGLPLRPLVSGACPLRRPSSVTRAAAAPRRAAGRAPGGWPRGGRRPAPARGAGGPGGGRDLPAHARRLVVLGGSAGGYTVLRALITHPGFFRVGICLYGVADLFGMASDTHKFEERYMDSLVGPLPQAADLYRELSPVFHAHKIQD